MIGGLGADMLNGNDGDDLLLAGTTAFNTDPAALVGRELFLRGEKALYCIAER